MSETSVKIRIDFGDERYIGHGRIQLLELIGKHGSITRAAMAMGMSYKRAWYLMDEFGAMFSEPLIERHHRGSKLTPFGSELVTGYREMEQLTLDVCAQRLRALENFLARPKTGKLPGSKKPLKK